MIKAHIYRLPRYALLIIITAICAQCGGSDARMFVLDLSPVIGKSYSYSFYHTTSSNFLDHSNSDTVRLEFDIEVTAHQDYLNKLKITFRNLEKNIPKPAVEIPGRRFGNGRMADLRSQLAAKSDSIFQALKGKQVNVIINEKGIVEKVEGTEDLVSQIASALNEDKRMVVQITHDFASEHAIADYLNILFSAPAGKKVKAGDNWGKDITLETKAPIHINTLYTLKELRVDSAYLDIQSKILGGTPGNFYLKGDQSGFAIVNCRSGLPYLIETKGHSITTTSQYDVRQEDHWIIILKKTEEKLLTKKHE